MTKLLAFRFIYRVLVIKLLVRTVEHAKLDLQKKDSVVCARRMSPVYAVNTVGNVKTACSS